MNRPLVRLFRVSKSLSADCLYRPVGSSILFVMKLSELKKIIDNLHDEMTHGGISDLELVIPNGKVSYGTIAHTKVKDIKCGFDWDSNLLIIIPKNKMVEIS